MKVKRIDLDDEEMPERVTVELTHDEAAYIATMVGKHSFNSAEQVMPGGGYLNSAISDALNGTVFNRFYEDGLAEAIAAVRGRS